MPVLLSHGKLIGLCLRHGASGLLAALGRSRCASVCMAQPRRDMKQQSLNAFFGPSITAKKEEAAAAYDINGAKTAKENAQAPAKRGPQVCAVARQAGVL